MEAEVIEPPVNADIRIVFEDEFLVAVNKPAPLPMHACGRYHRNSLVWILNQVYHPQKLRPLHRMDANTSGLVLLGRTRRVARIIQAQFEAGTVDKVYLAHVRGQPLADAFGADMPVSRQPGPGGTRSVDDDGLPAVTEFTVRERYDDGTSLVEARPLSGRTNQIRLHLAELGLPVVGDPLYGLNRTPDAIRSDGFVAGTLPVEARSMRLHAHSLRFQHPDGRSVHLVASPPAWLAAVTPSTLGPVE